MLVGLQLADMAGSNNKKSRQVYTLKTNENQQTMQTMMEVVPPKSSGVLGGVSQSQTDAPVQFYRFTNERKKQLRNDLYQDPFNPLATEENQPRDRT